MSDNAGTQALWPQMISALAAIDDALGLPQDGCNSTAQTIAAIRDMQAEIARLRAERVEDDALRTKLADILTRTANALKGDPGPLQSHSWHDLPERVTAAMNALAGAMELASANVQHDSDCAMHNEPAYPNGPCDCSVAIAKLHAELNACAAALPGPIYMDPPDGGSVTVAEQIARMAEDAARYRWLRSNANAVLHGVFDTVSETRARAPMDMDDAIDAAIRKGE